jgi:hypothetical protein
MNVAVIEPASSLAAAAAAREADLHAEALKSEWIDPEGDDWFAALYLELTQGSAVAAAGFASAPTRPRPELEHWFG